ncbi:MAG: universal stress protein [Gammaproteobacteria bacterium]|nr:universal stress protein [Gammaproteobacteria bacterium]
MNTMNAQLQASFKSSSEEQEPLPEYHHILLAVDSSDHSNRSLQDAVQLAGLWDADITGAHVYAAKLHDVRFRQMEGGLPEQFREEDELERQRDVHDDLITRGLSIITDSYLDHSERQCQAANLTFKRCSLEGKNYRELAGETNNGQYDLLVLGALGLGAVQGSRVGTVCQRVVRRSNIDTLVIKEPGRSITDGPIVVAVDGSTRAYGGLLTALALGERWQVPVKVIAAFDPYYHYVAFNRIADVLSEEAGKVFRFQEQEKLHEEIIDSGLAKIYQGHLEIAESIARDHGFEHGFEIKLLDGKPHDAIEKYLKEVQPSLLVIGKLGIHADADLDIGGTTENLLHNTTCALLISQQEFQPRVEVIAESTTSWTTQAEERMAKVPEFVQGMAKMAILRYAQERGHTVITESIVEEATAQLCPGHAKEAMADIVAAHDAGELAKKPIEELVMRWTNEATARLLSIDDLSLRGNLSMRAEKKARVEGAERVELEHIAAFLDSPEPADEKTAAPPLSDDTLNWNAAALARLMRVPEGFMRDTCKQRVEEYAHETGETEVTLTVAEAGLQRARETMMAQMKAEPGSVPEAIANAAPGTCPFGHSGEEEQPEDSTAHWTEAAKQRLEKVPEGFMRDLTRQRIEAFATRNEVTEITPQLIAEKYREWGDGSEKQHRQLDWSDDALQRIERIPDFVRGMVVKEVERCALEQGIDTVTPESLSKAMGRWEDMGVFHSESDPDLYKG